MRAAGFIGGRIVSLLADAGDIVKAGHVVTRMDSTDLSDSLKKSQAVSRAQKATDKANASYRGAGLDVVWPQFLAVAFVGGLFFSFSILRFRSVTGYRAELLRDRRSASSGKGGSPISLQDLDVVSAFECLRIPHATLAHETPDLLQGREFPRVEPFRQPGEEGGHVAGAVSQQR